MEVPKGLDTIDFFEIFFGDSLLPELVQVVGSDVTLKLIKTFGDVPFTLPSRDSLNAAIRNMRIYIAMTEEGVAAPVLGEQYGMSRQGVAQILKSTTAKIEALKERKKQGKLRFRLFNPQESDK